ncbi:MAG: hypothetical protein JWM81_1094 [Candidatus Saccharibacteria bacterium]|nr:hypothetical protein [Candidatus Saccharibacteria bacterium]
MTSKVHASNGVKHHLYRYIALAAFLLIGLAGYHYLHPALGFSYYEPSYLPPGVAIKAKRILIANGRATASLNFRTEDWVYEIIESKAGEDTVGPSDHNYDAKSVKPTCKGVLSAHGQPYRLCHWIDYGKISVYEVAFIKGGTMIHAQIPTRLQQTVSTDEVGHFVDSFAAKRAVGLPVLRSNAA